MEIEMTMGILLTTVGIVGMVFFIILLIVLQPIFSKQREKMLIEIGKE